MIHRLNVTPLDDGTLTLHARAGDEVEFRSDSRGTRVLFTNGSPFDGGSSADVVPPAKITIAVRHRKCPFLVLLRGEPRRMGEIVVDLLPRPPRRER